MTPAKSAGSNNINGINVISMDGTGSVMASEPSRMQGSSSGTSLRSSTPIQQNVQGSVVPTTPQRQIQAVVSATSSTQRYGHFNPFLRSSYAASVPNVPQTNTGNSGNSTFASYGNIPGSAQPFNRPLRHSSLHQVTLPHTPDSSPVSPMAFDTPGGVHTPTMNAPTHSVFSRDSGSTSFSSTAPTNRNNSGWPLSRTRSHDSPSSAFNYGPSSSVSSLGLENGFMLDRTSEQSSSSDEEYNGDYDSDELMSMGSRRQSLSTPHFLPVFRTNSNNSIKTQRTESQTDIQSDTSQSMGSTTNNNSPLDKYQRMNITNENEGGSSSNASGSQSSDRSALKNFFSTFRPDTKRSLLGGKKMSPSSMVSFFNPGHDVRVNSDPEPGTPTKTSRFSSIISSKNSESKTKRNDQHNDSNDNDTHKDNEEKEGRTTIRRFVSDGRSLRPKVKSFLRISRDLQDEMSPLDTEIKQEARVTTALRDDGSPEAYNYLHPFSGYALPPATNIDKTPTNCKVTNSFAAIQQPQRNRSLIRSDSLKSISSHTDLTDNETSMNSPQSTPVKIAPIATPSVKRKASMLENSEPAFLKRRAVSPGYVSPVVGSPTSVGGGKRNIKPLRDTSDGFEKMSLA